MSDKPRRKKEPGLLNRVLGLSDDDVEQAVRKVREVARNIAGTQSESPEQSTQEAGSPSAVADPKPEEVDLPAEEAGSPSDIAERPKPRDIRAMRQERRASSDIAEHPKPEEADLPAEEAGSPSAVAEHPKPRDIRAMRQERRASSDIAEHPKPEETDLPAEETGSPSAVADPKPEEAAPPAEEAGSPSDIAEHPKPEETDLPAEETGSPSAVADPKPEEAAPPAEEAGSPSDIAEHPEPAEAALSAEEAGSPSAVAKRTNTSVQSVPVGDWAYDFKEWAWATLSAMHEKAAESGVKPESVELSSKAIRAAMANRLGLTPGQRDFIGDVNGEREYVTRCTTMRSLLAHCDLIAQRGGSWVLTQSGVGMTVSQLHNLIDARLESFGSGKGPLQLQQRYRGHPEFPNGVSTPSELAPARSRSDQWVYNRHVWGVATLIAIRNVINRGAERYAANSEVTYEVERVLRLPPRATQITSRLNPTETECQTRCHTMRLHLLVAGFTEKQIGEPGWRLTEKGASADADDVVAGLDDVAQLTRDGLIQWNVDRGRRSVQVPDPTAFFYLGNSALAEDGLTSSSWGALRSSLDPATKQPADADSERANTQSQPEVNLAPVADLPIDAGMAIAEPAVSLVDRDLRAGETIVDANADSSDDDAVLSASENGESDGADATGKWITYAIDQEFAQDSVPYIASLTMSIIHDDANHGYPPTVQMINDKLIKRLRETAAASDRDGLRWSEGSVWWWRFHLARMSLWHGANAIHPVTDGDVDLYDAGAAFGISDGAANWDPEGLLCDVQQYLDAREPIKWNYDYRAWMWEVLLTLRTRPSDVLSRRPVATFQELTRALSGGLPMLAKYLEDKDAPLSELPTRLPEHAVRSKTALGYLQFLNLCSKRQKSGEWELTDVGDEITPDEFSDLLAMFADVTKTDLEDLGFEGVKSDWSLTYAGSGALADVDELKKNTRLSDTDLCVEVVRRLIEADENEVLESELWKTIGQERIGLRSPLVRSPHDKTGDLPPWYKSDPRARTLFAYRMRHVMQALSLRPSPTIRMTRKEGHDRFWELAERVDRQTLLSEITSAEDNGEPIDFGKDVAAYFKRHQYSTWRTEPWMKSFCRKFAELSRKTKDDGSFDGDKLDGTLFELLIARLLPKELGEGEAVEVHRIPKNDPLDHSAVDIVVKVRRTRQVGTIGNIPVYDHGGPEEVWLVQCKYRRQLPASDAKRIFDEARRLRHAASVDYPVRTALLVYLGDLEPDNAGEAISLTLQSEGSRDVSGEELLSSTAPVNDDDDELNFAVWDGGKVLELIKKHKVGVRGVNDGDTETPGELASDELEVDVQYLEQLKLEVADLQIREKQGQG